MARAVSRLGQFGVEWMSAGGGDWPGHRSLRRLALLSHTQSSEMPSAGCARIGGQAMTDHVCQQDADSPQGDPRPLQFGLRRLMIWVAGSSLLLALLAWGGDAMSRAPEAFLAIGLCLLALGVCLRRLGMVLLGVAVLFGLLIGVASFAIRQQYRSDLKPYSLRFKVVDEQTGRPVSGAVVRLVSISREKGTTDADGCVTLTGVFRTDFVDFSGASQPNYQGSMVEVDAESYQPVSCPLEEMSFGKEGSVITMRR